MASLANVLCVVMAIVTAGICEVVIPDSVSYSVKDLVYYKLKGTWYQAGRLCQSRGGQLMLVDSSQVAAQLQKLTAAIGAISAIHTRMVRHDDQRLYDNGTCQLVNTTSWDWHKAGDAAWDSASQCVLADGGSFKWKKRGCHAEDEYVCEYPRDSCYFQTHNSITLASLPVANATMTLCQSTCRQMIGCFATAPSGDVTSPPFAHCLFIVVADHTNPMASLTCPEAQYTKDETSNAKADFPSPPGGGTDPGENPHDCVPHNGTASASTNSTGQKPLADFLEEARNQTAADCSQITIQPTTVLQTIYVTPTPDLHAVYLSLTPEVITEYVTATPEVVTSYVTVSPEIHTISVTAPPLVHTVTFTPEIQTAYVTVSGPVSTAYVTATMTTQVVMTATVCSSSPSPPPTHTVSVCPNTTATPTSTNKTKEEVLEELSSVVEDLTVNPAQVSKTRRTKESSPDHRPSAKAIGFVAVLLLMLPPLVILLLDLPAFCRAVCSQHRPPKVGNTVNGGKPSP